MYNKLTTIETTYSKINWIVFKTLSVACSLLPVPLKDNLCVLTSLSIAIECAIATKSENKLKINLNNEKKNAKFSEKSLMN